MKEAYLQLQRAYSDMDDKFYDFRCQCRNVAQALREDLADFLGISAGEVRFFKSEELDEINANREDVIPSQYNDPFEAGELASGGSYRIGLCFGVSPVGETTAAWYPLIPLHFIRNDNGFTLLVEKSDRQFDLGQIPEQKVRAVSEWIVQRWEGIANEGYNGFLSGKKNNEMGFHAIFREQRA